LPSASRRLPVQLLRPCLPLPRLQPQQVLMQWLQPLLHQPLPCPWPMLQRPRSLVLAQRVGSQLYQLWTLQTQMQPVMRRCQLVRQQRRSAWLVRPMARVGVQSFPARRTTGTLWIRMQGAACSGTVTRAAALNGIKTLAFSFSTVRRMRKENLRNSQSGPWTALSRVLGSGTHFHCRPQIQHRSRLNRLHHPKTQQRQVMAQQLLLQSLRRQKRRQPLMLAH